MTAPYLMTVAEVAELLRITTTAKDPIDTTRQWLRRHDVPTYRRGQHLLVSRSAVIDALEASSSPRGSRLAPSASLVPPTPSSRAAHSAQATPRVSRRVVSPSSSSGVPA